MFASIPPAGPENILSRGYFMLMVLMAVGACLVRRLDVVLTLVGLMAGGTALLAWQYRFFWRMLLREGGIWGTPVPMVALLLAVGLGRVLFLVRTKRLHP